MIVTVARKKANCLKEAVKIELPIVISLFGTYITMLKRGNINGI